MEIEIRPSKTSKDFDLITEMTQYAFYSSPGELANREKTRPYFRGDHEFLLVVDEEVAATAASIPMTQNVRGKIFDMAGIAGVFTYPEFRRRGFINKLMQYMFQDMINKRQAITTLYPFKESFYGRYGYITLPEYLVTVIDSSKLSKLLELDLPVEYKRYEIKSNIKRVIELIYDFQQITHGMATFTPDVLKFMKELDYWVLEIIEDNQTTGFVIYKNEGFTEPSDVRYWFYKTSNAKYGIFRYFALHSEQISAIKLPIYNGEHIEQLWFDFTPSIKSREWVPSAMGRVALVNEISGMNVGNGSVHLEIIDNYIDENNSCWSFIGEKGELKVEKCNETDHASKITIHALSALVFGGYNPEDFKIRGWGSLTNDDINTVKIMFPQVITKLIQNF